MTADAPGAPALKAAASAVLVGLPFVLPLAAGPSVNVWQALAAWACAALLVGWVLPFERFPQPAVGVVLAFTCVAIAWKSGADAGTCLPAVAALCVVGLAACAGAGLVGTGAVGWLALGLLGAGLISAVLGLLQYHGLAGPLVPWTTAPEVGQAFGNLRQRNQFATLISMSLVALLWLHAAAGRRQRIALAAGAVLLLFALAASTSRTGLLQLVSIAGIGTFLAWSERRLPCAGVPRLPAPAMLLCALPIYTLGAWVLPWLASAPVEDMVTRLRQGAPDTHSRLVLWRNVVELIAQHPWAGWGWGELKFAHYSASYAGSRFSELLDNAHSLPLHLAVELGIPAALLICGTFGWMVLAARPWRETDPARLMAWGLLGAIVLHSLLEYPLWYGPFQLVFGLCLGLLWPGRRVPASSWCRPGALAATAGAVLLGAVLLAAWDYTRISQIYLPRDQRLPAYRDDTLAKLQDMRLFAGALRFAELALMQRDGSNAVEVHALARRVVHFSPEPSVIIKLIESAALLGLDDEVAAERARFAAAYPSEFVRWRDGLPLEDRPD